MIDQLAALGQDPQALRGHVGTVKLVVNDLVDVEIDGTIIPMIPKAKDIGTFSTTGNDRVLVYQLGDSWIVGAILPTEVQNLIPLGMIDSTPVGSLPDDWVSSATNSMVGREFAIVEDETLAHSGDRVLRATDPALFSTGGRRLVYLPPVPVIGGEDYIATAYYRKTIASGNSVEFFAYSGSSRRKASFDTALGTDGRHDLDAGTDFPGWTWLSGVISVPSGHTHVSLGVRTTANSSLGQGCVHYLDDFLLYPAS